MKRRTKKPAHKTTSNEAGMTKEKNCAPSSLKGAARQDQMLIAGLIFIVVLSAVVIGGILHSGKKQAKIENTWTYENNIKNLQRQINALKKQVAQNNAGTASTATSQKATTAQSSSSAAFEKAVNDKDFGKAEALMADRVYYVVDASDCCGDITKKEAASHLKNYIRDAKSFNFDQDQQVVKQMKVNLAETFANYEIGIGDNKMVLSYTVNKQGKVNNIMLSSSHLMYDLE